jgi:hypothetical protein
MHRWLRHRQGHHWQDVEVDGDGGAVGRLADRAGHFGVGVPVGGSGLRLPHRPFRKTSPPANAGQEASAEQDVLEAVADGAGP